MKISGAKMLRFFTKCCITDTLDDTEGDTVWGEEIKKQNEIAVKDS